MNNQLEAMKLVRDAIEQGIDLNLIGAKHILNQAIEQAQQAEPVADSVRSNAYDMIDRFLQNNLNSDSDYAEYSKALDSIYTSPPQRQPLDMFEVEKLAKQCGMQWSKNLQKFYELAAHGIKGDA